MRIYLVRHGQSLGNITDADMPDARLTDLGQQQARITAEHLAAMVHGASELQPKNGRAGEHIDRIISSPLLRCLGTAQPLAQALKLPIETWPELVEVRSGPSHKGPKRGELEQEFPEANFSEIFTADGWHYQGDESDVQAARRAQNAWQKLQTSVAPEATVAVFAHGTFNGFLLRAAMGVPEDLYMRFFQSNCCINVIDVHGDRVFVPTINGTWHFHAMADHQPPWLEFPAELAAKWNR